MKALSLWQPWASLVVLGLKQYETRSWQTNYRGTLVIHAAKEWKLTQEISVVEFQIAYSIDLTELPRGAALGTVDLVDVLRTEAVAGSEIPVGSREYNFGNYLPGRYAWKLANPILFVEPIPCVGHQRLWEVS